MQDSIEQYMQKVGQQARDASRVLTSASTSLKNHALSAIYTALENNQAAILAANQIDMEKGRSNQLDSALLDRLELTPARFKGMLQGLKDVIALVDPIGKSRILHIAPQAFKLGKCVYL
ncbi:gamma-glutamyl phosphate reductase domain protein [Acinetobacter baumannii 44327_2]|nr:gamma-glutamyl phosphate reductase domain protein [Acinetobacter baumannii 44327_2]